MGLCRLADSWDLPSPKDAGVSLGVLSGSRPDHGVVVSGGGLPGLALQDVSLPNMRLGLWDDAVFREPLGREHALVDGMHFRRVTRSGLRKHQSIASEFVLACTVGVEVIRQDRIRVDAAKVGRSDFVWQLAEELLFIRTQRNLMVICCHADLETTEQV